MDSIFWWMYTTGFQKMKECMQAGTRGPHTFAVQRRIGTAFTNKNSGKNNLCYTCHTANWRARNAFIYLWQTLVSRAELWLGFCWVNAIPAECGLMLRSEQTRGGGKTLMADILWHVTRSSIVEVNSLLRWKIPFLILCLVHSWCDRYRHVSLQFNLQWEHCNHFLHQDHINNAINQAVVCSFAYSHGVNTPVMAALKTSRQYPQTEGLKHWFSKYMFCSFHYWDAIDLGSLLINLLTLWHDAVIDKVHAREPYNWVQKFPKYYLQMLKGCLWFCVGQHWYQPLAQLGPQATQLDTGRKAQVIVKCGVQKRKIQKAFSSDINWIS